jgi:hypothetical protein
MSTRDHDEKLTEDRLGRYTPGARLGPDAGGPADRVEAAESRSWTNREPGETRPQAFSGAEVTPYGQLVSGAADQVGGGFGGANVGGYGQQGLGSQWGQAGYGPLTQGATYSAGGGSFGPTGFAPYPEQGGPGGGRREGAPGQPGAALDRPSPTPLFGSPRDFGGSHHDDHEPHYRHWRDAKLAAHDRDYARWRDEQARRYDEDYRTWRNSHHAAFSQAFDGWRSQRTRPPPSSSAAPVGLGDINAIHGANPTLGDIADGGTGAPHHRHDHHDHAPQDRRDDEERRDNET